MTKETSLQVYDIMTTSNPVPARVLKPDKITSYVPLPVKRARRSATPISSEPWYWKKVHSNT